MTFSFNINNSFERQEDLISVAETEMSTTTMIANVIRRAGRFMEETNSVRSLISQLFRDGYGKRRMYQAGVVKGQLTAPKNLADVLYVVQSVGLGRAAAVEESNSHLVIRVFECECCKINSMGCEFTAGFIAGALLATGRYAVIEARETTCGQFPGDSCVFHIDLRPKL